MNACVLSVNPLSLSLHTSWPKPHVSPKDVLVQIKNVGICGSDVEYWKKGHIGSFVVKECMVIGHEAAGVIVEVGEDVKHLSVGQKVALEPGIPCGECEVCRGGCYNLCKEMRFFATPPVHGALCDVVAHPASLCFPLPEPLTCEHGALAEPLSVGMHACNQAGVEPGSTVFVAGAGPIALATMLVAKAIGAARVVLSDIRAERVDAAVNLFGADACVLIDVTATEEENMAAIHAALQGPCTAAIECTGHASSIRNALRSIQPGGTLCCVGLHDVDVELPLMQANVQEVSIVGVFRYRNAYPKVIALMAAGRLDPIPLITHRFPFDEKSVLAGFDTAATGKDAIKVMFAL